MTLIKSRLGRQFDGEIYYGTRPKPTTIRGILLNFASFAGLDNQTSLATLLQAELPVLNGYARATLGTPDSSAFNSTNNSWQVLFSRPFSASGANLNYNAIATLINGASVANQVVSAINTSTDRLTVTAHGLADATPVSLTVDTGGTYPTNGQSVTGATEVYTKSIDANTLELYTDVGLTTKVDFSSAGSGTLRLRNCSGLWDLLVTFPALQVITAGQTMPISFNPGWLAI